MAALLLGGCQKAADQTIAQAIRFGAGATDTKATWGSDYSQAQQIVWEGGESVRIKSNYAYNEADSNQSYAEYEVTREGEYERYSWGALSSPSGLLWDYGHGYDEHEFWAVCPSREIYGSGHYIDGTLPDDAFLMVAHASGDELSDGVVPLYFYPAFTTLRFYLRNESGEDLGVSRFSIMANASNPLQGSFTAAIGDSGVEDVEITDPANYRETSITTGGETTVWEGSFSGQGLIGQGQGGVFASVQAGDQIRLYYSPDQVYGQGSDSFWAGIYQGKGSWTNQMNASKQDGYYEIEVTSGNLALLTDASNEAIFFINSGGGSINKISVYSGAAQTETFAGYVAEDTSSRRLDNYTTLETEFILFPTDLSLERLTVEFTDGSTKSMSLEGISFEAAKQYRISLLLPDTRVIELVDFVVVANGQTYHSGSDRWTF